MLGLQFDESTNEFFSIYGQFAAPELVGTRRIVAVDVIVAQMGECMVKY